MYILNGAIILSVTTMMLGCGGVTPDVDSNQESSKPFFTCKVKSQKSIGVSDVDITSKIASYIYDKKGIQTNLTVAIKDSQCFDVVDWQRLRSVVERNKLEISDIGKGSDKVRNVKDILLVDYFLVANIGNYSDDITYPSGTISKEKTRTISVSIELILKDAFSNEVLASVSHTGAATQTLTQSLGFGSGSNKSGELPNKALNQAMNGTIKKLTAALSNK